MQPDPIAPLRGEPGAPGTAIGPLWTLDLTPSQPATGATGQASGTKGQASGASGPVAGRPISGDDAVRALAETAAALEQMAAVRRSHGEAESAEILSMQAVMALDPALSEAVRSAAASLSGQPAGGERVGLDALLAAGESQAAALAAIPDEYLAARAADIRDVVARAARTLTGDRLKLPSAPVILIGEDLPPSVSTEIPRERLMGIALRGGSRTAHAVILARAAGIPCIVATSGLAVDGSLDGAMGLLNGEEGLLTLNPNDELLSEARRGASAQSERRAAWEQLRGQTPKNAQGAPIHLLANIGSQEDAARAVRVGAAGVGLLRTEFALLNRQAPPSEAELTEGLTTIFKHFSPGTPITLRLADIGGDKEIPYLKIPPEQNPFLGIRGYRLAMVADRPDLRALFQNQVAAALRAAASTGVRLKIMAPMITLRPEVDDLLALVADARRDLAARGEGSSAAYPAEIGIMVEVPAAALTVDLLAPGLNFISVGTTDLTQSTAAADRTNAALAGFQDASSPAVISLIRRAYEAATRAGLEVGVCGELAGTVAGARLLAELGLTELSMEPAAIDEVRAQLLG
ncbi:MAG: putative PEP-binding protein [Candidatus Limnocylindrus sp.]